MSTSMDEIRETFKPRDVEELIDWYFHRPAAALLVRLLVHTPLSANQVTVLSGIAGILSGVAFYLGGAGSDWWVLGGAFLLFASIILDCADGQLARLRGSSSIIGRALDGGADYFATVSAFFGLGFCLDARFGTTWPVWPIWVFGSLAGASMVWHCFVYDGVKNMYLANTKPAPPDGSPGLLTPEQIRAEMDVMRQRRNWLYYGLLWILHRDTVAHFQAIQGMRDQGQSMTRTAAERTLYRNGLQRSMRLWSFLGLGTHLFLLVTAGLLLVVNPWVPVGVWLFMLGPMNLLAVYLLLTDPARHRRVRTAIERQRAAAS